MSDFEMLMLNSEKLMDTNTDSDHAQILIVCFFFQVEQFAKIRPKLFLWFESSCWPTDKLRPKDITYLQEVIKQYTVRHKKHQNFLS